MAFTSVNPALKQLALSVANIASYSGSPDYVEINAVAYYDPNSSALAARIAPVRELLKNGTVVARSASGYIRDSNSHD